MKTIQKLFAVFAAVLVVLSTTIIIVAAVANFFWMPTMQLFGMSPWAVIPGTIVLFLFGCIVGTLLYAGYFKLAKEIPFLRIW